MADNKDINGQTQKHPSKAGKFHQPMQRFTLTVAVADLGSGASSAHALTGFPTDVVIFAVTAEVTIDFTGEPDLAIKVGDTGNDDELVAALTIHELGVGWLPVVSGARQLPGFEADYFTAGGDVTFTATELDDVTAGSVDVHIWYMTPRLSTAT